MNMQKLLKQAKEMEEKIQRELTELEVEASVGGGLVTIRMNGHKMVLTVRIDPEAMDPDETELLQDLMQAAFNQATGKVDEAMKGRFGSLAGAIPKMF